MAWKAAIPQELLQKMSPNGSPTTVGAFKQYRRIEMDDTLDRKARKAFEILARENSRMLMVYLRSLVRDEAAIDDLFQESMIVAWRRLDECDLDRPFRPWLRGIASRLVMAHYRKQKLTPIVLQDAVLSTVDRHFENISLLAGDTWDDKVVALRDCIDALPDRQKVAIGSMTGSRHPRATKTRLLRN